MPSNENAKTAEPRWKRWVNFFTEDVWRFDFSELTRVRKSALQALQVLLLVSERFFKDRLMLRAGALTYTTMLSIVPLLAFMFAVLKGLGVQRRLEPIVLERVAVGSQEIVTRLMNYIDKVKVGSLGAVGLVLLVISIILVIDNVENAFNDIWSITSRRTYLRKFSDYLALIDRQYLASLREMKVARLVADKLLKEHPELCDAWIAAGVENYMLSVRPAPVRWLPSP